MKEEKVTRETIEKLVNKFYSKVRLDPELGPIFAHTIGTSDEAWKPHLKKISDFWEAIMLLTLTYQGNVLQKHRMLPFFEEKLFDQWLMLFEETAREIYNEAIATQFIEKSKRIAESLKLGLYFTP